MFVFTLLMSMVACALASLGPVLRATRATAIGSGKDRALGGPSGHGLRFSLLAMQIALSTVLLVGAGLLTRAISHAMSLDPGFVTANVHEVSIKLPRHAPADALPRIRETLTMADLPLTALSFLQPITGSRMEIGVRRSNQGTERNRRLALRPVSASYFGVLGIPVLKGRPFADRLDARELVVSQSAARLLWPSDDPIGKRLFSGATDTPSEPREVVGVVADVPTTTVTELEPVIYQPVGGGERRARPRSFARGLSTDPNARAVRCARSVSGRSSSGRRGARFVEGPRHRQPYRLGPRAAGAGAGHARRVRRICLDC